MDSVLAWAHVIPTVLALIAVLFIPGFLIATVLFKRSAVILRLAQAPAWSVGLVAMWSVLSQFFPFRWGLFPFVGFSLIVLLLAWGVSHTKAGSAVHAMMPEAFGTKKEVVFRLLATLAVWIVVILPIILFSSPLDIVQGGDSSYHYNQLWLMEQTGNANPLNANATMAGLDPSGWYYPDTWHALLSLVAAGQSQAVVVANSFLVVTPLVWLLGIGAWTVAVGGRKSLYEWSFLGSVLAPVAMIRLELVTTLWPFVLGMVVLPGMMAVWYFATRKIRRQSSTIEIVKSVISVAVITLVPLVGLVGIHPATLLPPSFAFFVYVVFELVRFGIRHLRAGEKRIAARLISGAFLLVYLVMFIVDGPLRIKDILFHRYPQVGFEQVPQKLFASISLYMPEGGLIPLVFYVFVFIAVVTAIALAYKKNRWAMLAGWLSQWLLLLGTLFPLGGLSRITSLYYNYPDRPKAALAIFVVPLLALLGQTVSDWLRTKTTQFAPAPRWIAIGLSAVVAYMLVFPAIAQDVRNSFYPTEGQDRYLADSREMDMIRRAENTLPDDALVLGDPASGAALLQPVSNVRVVWPFPNQPWNRDDRVLLTHFKDIGRDARICDVLQEHGIEYFYADKPGYYNGNNTSTLRPGLFGVKLGKGFTTVDRGGSAAIYKIDLCSLPERPTTYVYERTATTCSLLDGGAACLD